VHFGKERGCFFKLLHNYWDGSWLTHLSTQPISNNDHLDSYDCRCLPFQNPFMETMQLDPMHLIVHELAFFYH